VFTWQHDGEPGDALLSDDGRRCLVKAGAAWYWFAGE